MKWNMRLPHGCADPAKRYAMPDPDTLGPMLDGARDRAYYTPEDLRREDLQALITLATGYMALTTFAGGQEAAVRKLRDIWRARRARQ